MVKVPGAGDVTGVATTSNFRQAGPSAAGEESGLEALGGALTGLS